MNDSITHFLQKQTCATICCVDGNGLPYCFNVFYAFHPGKARLYFKSSERSRHTSLMATHSQVAGTILPDKLNSLLIKGVQFTGTAMMAIDSLPEQAAFYYYKRFPFALAMTGELWLVELQSIKMTDNSKGFGKKLSWNKEENVVEV
jgi:uncharacterized protein YhbP (UPF0306 family)